MFSSDNGLRFAYGISGYDENVEIEEDGIDEINFRMKRAIGKNVKSNRRNKQKSRNTNRRNRPKTTGDSNYARHNIEQQNRSLTICGEKYEVWFVVICGQFISRV